MRRTLTRIILFLLLGAIVNVTVAWGFAVWVTDVHETAKGALLTKSDAKGWVLESWWADQWEGLGTSAYRSMWIRMTVNKPSVAGRPHPRVVLPSWLHFDDPPAAFTRGDSDREEAVAWLFGWPMRSLVWTSFIDQKNDVPIDPRPVIRLGVRDDGTPCVVPLRPLWPGSLINTLFYAAIVAALFLAPGRIRRVVRRRRGRCATCGYDRRGNPSAACPECGTL